MLPTRDRSSAEQGQPVEQPAAFDHDGLESWLLGHVSPGHIACLGNPFDLPLDPDAYRVVALKDLGAGTTGGATFDHAWASNFLDRADDATAAAWRLFHLVKAGGTLLLTVPFGVSRERQSSRAFYVGSLRRLIDPVFEIMEIRVIEGRLVAFARRRDAPSGVPTGSLDPEERAFYEHDQQVNLQLQELAAELVRSGARYRGMVARVEAQQADLTNRTQQLKDLQRKVAMIRRWLRIPLAVLRRVRRLKAGAIRRWRRLTGKAGPSRTGTGRPGVGGSEAPDAVIPQQRPPASAAPVVGSNSKEMPSAPSWREVLRANFTAWLDAAASATGDEVVVMFSGTTFVQEHRGNRPIRLTNVYLSRRCPVFFNYYRPGEKEPLPEHPDELLFQSPIDATQGFLDDVLTADFGGKKKLLFVSFPHSMMVRYMMLAAQHGWVTIYDVRDDWEEFAKVGMARWYVPSFERYVATFADVVTAVSRPLARKIQMMAGGRDVHVVPNALDTRFPRPTGPRQAKGSPVVGYFGHLTDRWFDWPLVVAAAERYPMYRFELAGHQHPKDLALPPNVELLGLVGHAELAERSRSWSVAMIPFKNGPLADAVDPIKIYEYLHLRVPVLATYFPQCRDYPGTTITEGREEFIERLGQLVGTQLRDEEIASWLSRNTWEHRVDQYSSFAAHVRRGSRDKVVALVGGEL